MYLFYGFSLFFTVLRLYSLSLILPTLALNAFGLVFTADMAVYLGDLGGSGVGNLGMFGGGVLDWGEGEGEVDGEDFGVVSGAWQRSSAETKRL